MECGIIITVFVADIKRREDGKPDISRRKHIEIFRNILLLKKHIFNHFYNLFEVL